MGGVASDIGRAVGGVATLGLSELALGAVSKPKIPAAPALPTPPKIPKPQDTAGANEAAEAVRRAARSRSATGGRGSSILTSPLGLTEPADTAKRTLLGR